MIWRNAARTVGWSRGGATSATGDGTLAREGGGAAWIAVAPVSVAWAEHSTGASAASLLREDHRRRMLDDRRERIRFALPCGRAERAD